MSTYNPEFIGPFVGHHALSVDGYLVPHVKIHPHNGAEDGKASLILDDRFIIEGTDDEIKKWAWIVANALAIGAGYSCFGENSAASNPYKVKISALT